MPPAQSDGPDAEDFISWAMLRLVEHDYAMLRRFRGESALRTYLVAVIATLHRDYRVLCWGRWQLSAAARRGGAIAIRLETLVYGDGLTLVQAIETLRTAGETAESDHTLARLFATLPRRHHVPSRRAFCGPVDSVVRDDAETTPESLVLAEEEHIACVARDVAVARALATLAEEDQVIVRLRFWERMTIADIARRLQQPQRPLYRRLERALALLRRSLERGHPAMAHRVGNGAA